MLIKIFHRSENSDIQNFVVHGVVFEAERNGQILLNQTWILNMFAISRKIYMPHFKLSFQVLVELWQNP